MVLKGVATDDEVYPRVGLRPSGDIDLMVPPSRLLEGEQVLQSVGFTPYGDLERQEAFRAHHHHLVPYVHPRTQTVVELHWNIVNPEGPYKMEVDGLWDRARSTALAGAPYLKLAPEDHLLHLCLHFLSDRQSSRGSALSQLCDIALILNRQALVIDWGRFTERALQYGVGPPVYAALYGSALVTGTDLDDVVSDRLRPETFDEKKARLFVIRRVIKTGREVSVGLSEALALPGTSAKVKGLVQALRPPARWTPGAVSRQEHPERTGKNLLARPLQILAGVGKLALHIPTLWQAVILERWLGQILGQTKAVRLGIGPSRSAESASVGGHSGSGFELNGTQGR